MKCDKCFSYIPESIGECTYCNEGILVETEGIPEGIPE